MKHGLYWESTARDAYENITGNLVDLCGFAKHGEIDFFGASLDGLVGADGCIEIKCPTIATFTKYLMSKTMPTDYIPQMLAQLAVTKRKWCDFAVFFPSENDASKIKDEKDAEFFGKITMPENMRLKVWRFEPDPGDIEEVEEVAKVFLGEVDDLFDCVVLG
jgi:predicted phage-related endonuclease